MKRNVFTIGAMCLLLNASPSLACSLKINDLEASFSLRQSDTVRWEQELEAVERSLSASVQNILSQMNDGATCSAQMTREISDSLAKLDQIQANNAVPRGANLNREIDQTFDCFADIAERLGSVRADAVKAGEALKVQRYNAIADKLSKLDREYTTALVDAESARLRNTRLRSMAQQYTELCSDDGF